MRHVPLLVLGLSLGATGAARAGEPPAALFEAREDLDGDGAPERVLLAADGTLRVDGAGGERGRLALGLMGRAAVRLVRIEGRPHLHLAQPAGPRRRQRVVALHPAPRLLVEEVTGPRGDGEHAVELGVGEAGIERWQTAPLVRRCDGETRLFRERFDLQAGRFVPSPVPAPDGEALPALTAAPPGLAGARPLGLFRWTATSTDGAQGDRPRADLLGAPVELGDGKPATRWIAGPPGGGVGEWVAARAVDGPRRVVALRIDPGGPPPASLVLLLDGERRYRVTPPRRGPFWVAPPAADTACLAVVVAAPPADGRAAPALAEVTVFTDADGADALAVLTRKVLAGGAEAEAAARTLAGQGPDGARALLSVLHALPPDDRMRLVVLAAAAAPPDLAPALSRLLGLASEAERGPILAALRRAGEAAVAPAVALLGDRSQAGPTRADAARLLGPFAARSAEARAALIAAAGEPDVDAAVREALVRALPASPELVEATLAALLAPPPTAAPVAPDAEPIPAEELQRLDEARRVALALALEQARLRPPLSEKVAAALVAAPEPAGAFALRYRHLTLLGALRAPAALPRFRAVLSQEKDEVLRWAAVRGARGLGAEGQALAAAAVADRDPRVREAALPALPPDDPRLLARFERDRWPFVRAAAAERLAGACTAALPSLERRVAGDERGKGRDPAPEVRGAALRTVAACAPKSPLFARVVLDPAQPPAVRETAASLLAASGQPGAAGALAKALDQVLGDPAADDRAAALAVALLGALGRLGDTSTPILEAIGAALAEPASGAVRAAAVTAAARLCAEGTTEALRRLAEDPDPAVRRALGRAASCTR